MQQQGGVPVTRAQRRVVFRNERSQIQSKTWLILYGIGYSLVILGSILLIVGIATQDTWDYDDGNANNTWLIFLIIGLLIKVVGWCFVVAGRMTVYSEIAKLRAMQRTVYVSNQMPAYPPGYTNTPYSFPHFSSRLSSSPVGLRNVGAPPAQQFSNPNFNTQYGMGPPPPPYQPEQPKPANPV